MAENASRRLRSIKQEEVLGEIMDDFMNDCSVITATYHVDGQLIGKVGVIGLTRMKYGEVTSIVEYLTQNLNETFGLENSEDEDNGG